MGGEVKYHFPSRTQEVQKRKRFAQGSLASLSLLLEASYYVAHQRCNTWGCQPLGRKGNCPRYV